MSSGLSEAEWAVIERLAECHSLMAELDGLDFTRFDHAIQGLQEQVLALPVKRMLTRQCRASLPSRPGSDD